ncbi:hypothetical protein PVE99_12055 [Priestia megaterium]|uniref:DUF4209 domain-containing protein n=1 Tax=Priestia megaterium TaxID=1404 RepID=A0ABD4WSH8_PRIMG|nr:hypothetical protein [Priestia megaterium]MDD9783131.1 hypothetical protein [Priestia megaterium]
MSHIIFKKKMQRIRLELNQSIKAISSFADEVKTAFNEWKILYEEAYPGLLNLAELIAKKGWLIPPNMGISEMLDVVDEENPEEIFKKFYDNKVNYKEMKITLNNCDLLDKDLMKECLLCYENNTYKVIVPALLILIEKLLIKVCNTKKVGRGLSRAFEEEVQKRKDMSFGFLHLHAASTFINEIFDKHDFDEERLESWNRAWVLHGRDDSKYWTDIEVLKLLNLLFSLTFINEIMNEEV